MYCYSPSKNTKIKLIFAGLIWLAVGLSPLYRDNVHHWGDVTREFIVGLFSEKVIVIENGEQSDYYDNWDPCWLKSVVCEDEISREAIDSIIKKYFGKNWRLARAVMMAEGNYNLRAFNPTNGSNDRGIWQISAKWHPEVSDSCAYDVECSTRIAYQLSKGGIDWSQWWGYKTGSYKKFLN